MNEPRWWRRLTDGAKCAVAARADHLAAGGTVQAMYGTPIWPSFGNSQRCMQLCAAYTCLRDELQVADAQDVTP